MHCALNYTGARVERLNTMRGQQDWIARYKHEAAKHLTNMRERLDNIVKNGVDMTVPSHAMLDKPRIDGDENLKELYRLAHTLKGSAGMVGLLEVEVVAEQLEELLGGVYYDPSSYDATIPSKVVVGMSRIEALLAIV